MANCRIILSTAMLLSVEDYSLDYETPSGTLRALDRVSLSVDHGEGLGLVGESGSGKRRVELRDPEAIMRRYPHEVSGGEKQRVVLAAAFAPHPELILFDEPTTALDIITGARILELFRRLRRETKGGGLYISHDLALVSRVADRVAVIERGPIVEQAPASRIFSAPAHAYTSRLMTAVPRPERRLVADKSGETSSWRRMSRWHHVSRRLMARRRTLGARDISLAVRGGEILGVVASPQPIVAFVRAGHNRRLYGWSTDAIGKGLGIAVPVGALNRHSYGGLVR